MVEIRNKKSVNLKLERGDVCDLLLAIACTKEASGAEKWGKLHDKILDILKDWDKKYDEQKGGEK